MHTRRLIGIELETEGCSTLSMPESDYWAYHEEASLRDDSCEFVLRKPLSGRPLQLAINELDDLVKDSYLTDRCSLHVHVDVGDLSLSKVYNVCLAYTIFEKVLYAISGNRYYNKYCVPAGLSDNLRMYIALLYVNRKTVTPDHRYGGLNLNALSKFGSLEFRMHWGTLDMDELKEWCQILHDLVDNSFDLDPAYMLECASSYEGILHLSDEIFTTDTVKRYLSSLAGSWCSYDTKTCEQIHLRALRYKRRVNNAA